MNCLTLIKFCIFIFFTLQSPILISQNQEAGFVELDSGLTWNLFPGEKKIIDLVFRIREGYHVQANEGLDENLIPTSISMQVPAGIKTEDPLYPRPLPFRLRYVQETMMVFHDELPVHVPVSVMANTLPGSYTFNGVLTYQACDSIKCYFPRNLLFEIQINVK